MFSDGLVTLNPRRWLPWKFNYESSTTKVWVLTFITERGWNCPPCCILPVVVGSRKRRSFGRQIQRTCLFLYAGHKIDRQFADEQEAVPVVFVGAFRNWPQQRWDGDWLFRAGRVVSHFSSNGQTFTTWDWIYGYVALEYLLRKDSLPASLRVIRWHGTVCCEVLGRMRELQQ